MVRRMSRVLFVLGLVVMVVMVVKSSFIRVEGMEQLNSLTEDDLLDLEEITEDDFEYVDDISDVNDLEAMFALSESKPVGWVEFEDGHRVSLSTKTDHETLLGNAGFMNPGILTKRNEGFTNTAIAGHNMKNGSLFGNLRHVEIGEKVVIKTSKKDFVYKVYDKLVVEATQVEMIEDSAAEEFDIVSLMTCTPGGKERLFVLGELIEVVNK